MVFFHMNASVFIAEVLTGFIDRQSTACHSPATREPNIALLLKKINSIFLKQE